MGRWFGGSVGIRTILMKNNRQKQYSQFPPVHDFGKWRWGVAYVPCVTNLRVIYAWVIWWQVTGMLSLAEHWHGRRALSNHVCAHSVIAMWHMIFLQHLVRACSEQSRSTAVLPINRVIQMPQCLSGFVNHDYSPHKRQVTQKMFPFDDVIILPTNFTGGGKECSRYLPLIWVWKWLIFYYSWISQGQMS